MKIFKLVFALIFTVAAVNVQAQSADTKDSVKVYGNCGMCKNRIEKAAKAAGATTASWNDETQVLAITFTPGKSTTETIEKAVAAVGHDTKNFTAPTEVYNKLHGCCQYERKAEQEKKQ